MSFVVYARELNKSLVDRFGFPSWPFAMYSFSDLLRFTYLFFTPAVDSYLGTQKGRWGMNFGRAAARKEPHESLRALQKGVPASAGARARVSIYVCNTKPRGFLISPFPRYAENLSSRKHFSSPPGKHSDCSVALFAWPRSPRVAYSPRRLFHGCFSAPRLRNA